MRAQRLVQRIQHLVLEVEYEPVVTPSGPFEPSAEAAGVVALLDRPPRFRVSDSGQDV